MPKKASKIKNIADIFTEMYNYLKTRKVRFIHWKYNINFRSIYIYYVVAFAFIFICVFGVFLFSYFKIPDAQQNIVLLPEDHKDISDIMKLCPNLRKIDGICVDSEDKADIFPFAVVVENHTQARPLSGVSKANLVFEALVEGGITRLLLIFADGQEVEEIGPVRSARPYFVLWAKEFDAMFAHVGGSPEALGMLNEYDIKDFDEYFYGNYFWRSQKRYAPHNAYTSFALLQKGKDKYYPKDKITYESWMYKNEDSFDKRGPDKQRIIIDYSMPEYEVKWMYDRNNNSYSRYNNGRPFTEADGGQIGMKNIVVMFADTKVIDDIGRRSIKVIGEGKAEMYLDGRQYKGAWQKKNSFSRTMFFDEQGREFFFNQGATWINVVPSEMKTVYEETVESDSVSLNKSN